MDSAAPVRSKAQEVPSLLQAVWDHGKRQGVRPEDAVRDPTVLWAAYESLVSHIINGPGFRCKGVKNLLCI
jgi:hypothetical protein